MVLGGTAIFWAEARAYLLSVAFTWAGLACVVNAKRCGRFHCHFTGPLYLALGTTSTLIGFGVLDMEWVWIGVLFVLGTVAAFVPEFVGRRYMRDGSAEDSR